MFLSPPLSSTFNVTCHALAACTKSDYALTGRLLVTGLTDSRTSPIYMMRTQEEQSIAVGAIFYFEVGNYSVISHLTDSHLSLEETGTPLPGHSTGAPVALALFSMEPLPCFVFPPGALLH